MTDRCEPPLEFREGILALARSLARPSHRGPLGPPFLVVPRERG